MLSCVEDDAFCAGKVVLLSIVRGGSRGGIVGVLVKGMAGLRAAGERRKAKGEN